MCNLGIFFVTQKEVMCEGFISALTERFIAAPLPNE